MKALTLFLESNKKLKVRQMNTWTFRENIAYQANIEVQILNEGGDHIKHGTINQNFIKKYNKKMPWVRVENYIHVIDWNVEGALQHSNDITRKLQWLVSMICMKGSFGNITLKSCGWWYIMWRSSLLNQLCECYQC
jgi:hypothetical protein